MNKSDQAAFKPKVKMLIWRKTYSQRNDTLHDTWIANNKEPLEYCIELLDGHYFLSSFKLGKLAPFEKLEEAQAAAQAAYERYILRAIEEA
ncbi:hypothetical protein [Castellaniella sp.]|uniref:hypothetical protein n=1 Tax=Castellaniella sp. TaxID=1955812 RepID=UPI002AFFE11B|nr:hypothetical protein [Castellaniella sp.]